jgi:hypothetical protein
MSPSYENNHEKFLMYIVFSIHSQNLNLKLNLYAEKKKINIISG